MGSVSDAQLRALTTGGIPDQKSFFQSHFQNGKKVSSEKLKLLNHSVVTQSKQGPAETRYPKQVCLAKK